MTCDPLLGIVSTPAPDGTPCADNVCLSGATCAAGVCAGGSARDCSSGQTCMIDGCDPATGCTHTPKPAGTPAPNASLCDGNEVCAADGTVILGTPLVCNSNDICIIDGCDPATGCTTSRRPGCDPTPTKGDAPFETRASILGVLVASGGGAVAGASFLVTNAPAEGAALGAPRTDVSAQVAADGSFRLRLTTFPDLEGDRTPPLHVLLRVDASG